jgi:pSer/pThr/pTyr-binding forkhead associated (FHA) protein
VIPELSVSRNHAVLRFADDHWVLEDRDSHNGTFVNGTKIGWPQGLQDGDQLQFGDVVVVFQVIS